MRASRDVLKLHNHGLVRTFLASLSSDPRLQHLDEAVHAQTRAWLGLGRKHLRVARLLRSTSGDWRSVVSRAYYAAYNGSKAIRYLVHGSVRLDGDDHKHVADLPGDFPDREYYATFLTDLREARNKADYDPWPDTFRELPRSPEELLTGAEAFLRAVIGYLGLRGVKA